MANKHFPLRHFKLSLIRRICISILILISIHLFYAFDSSLLRDLGEPWDYYFSSSYIQATYFDYFDYFDALISSRLIFYLSSTGQVCPSSHRSFIGNKFKLYENWSTSNEGSKTLDHTDLHDKSGTGSVNKKNRPVSRVICEITTFGEVSRMNPI